MGFDIAFGILLLLGALRGYRKGFASQMIQLTGLAFGVVFAMPVSDKLLPAAAPRMETVVPDRIHQPIVYLASILLIWFCVSLVGLILLGLCRRGTPAGEPSSGDRLLGITLGVAKSAFLIAIVVFILDQLGPKTLGYIEVVEKHHQKSLGVKIASRAKVMEHLLQTREVKIIRTQVGRLVDYYSGGSLRRNDDALRTVLGDPSKGAERK